MNEARTPTKAMFASVLSPTRSPFTTTSITPLAQDT